MMGDVTLTEFLLARIAEDEEAARTYERNGWQVPDEFDWPRVIAGCEAKAEIVKLHVHWDGDPNDYGQTRQALEFLALPYADHPDYREEWRPDA